MSHRFIIAVLCAAIAGCASAPRAEQMGTQQTGTQQPGAVSGTIRDGATGRPIVGARVALRCDNCYGRHPTDSAGHYRVDRLPAGKLPLEAHCPSATMLGSEITQTTVAVTAGGETRLDIEVPAGRCDEPGYSERRGVFRGFWTPGFESSGFFPCADSSLGVPAPLLPGKRLVAPSAWATLTPAARSASIVWPRDAPRDPWGNPTYFVTWRGVLRGPGSYGHMGVSAFSMTVDSVIAVDTRGPADCRTR